MKRILVTGGAGFIGSHLCKKLLDRGDSVVCLDNLFTGSYDNIKPFENNSSFEFINGDVTEPIRLEVNEIYNLACPASPKYYQLDPVKTIRASVIGITNMLDLAKANGAKILQASTSEVYGDPLEHPQKESYWGNVNPIGIRSCYDEGKRAAETLMCDYRRQFKIDTKIVRIFNTYGENMAQDDGRVVSNFIVQALQDKPITIYGDGSQTRSFCYVSDLVGGLVRAMDCDYHEPINLGNPSERTMLELAHLILDITKSKSRIVFQPLPSDDPIKRKPDITLAKKLLVWEPQIGITEGLERTIEYFKNAK